MMLPTHALVGLALAAPLALVIPELGFAALTGGLVGSVVPDLDMYAGHRKTLHFPTLSPLAAAAAVPIALVAATPITVAIAAALVGGAVHCRMDVYGGGLELRPWEETSNRAVYDHVAGAWCAPRRWIRYDGSPGDFAIAAALGVPLFVLLEGPFAVVAALAVVVAGGYALLRRRLANFAPSVFGAVPAPLQSYVPGRYCD